MVLAILAAMAVLAGNALANFLAPRQPLLAVSLWSAHSRALQTAADAVLLPRWFSQGTLAAPPATDLARRALRSSVVAPAAYRTLAMEAMATPGQDERAKRLLNVALSQTRRDVPAQMLTMKQSIDSRDLDGALHSLDLVLRASIPARQQLMPVFAQLIALPEARTPLAKLVQERPNWLLPVFDGAIGLTTDARPLADAILDSGGLGQSVQARSVMVQLAQRLAVQGEAGQARALLARIEPSHRPAVASLRLTGDGDGPFDWRVLANSRSTALIDSEAQALDVDIGLEAQVEIARKLVLLPPGSHRQRMVVELAEPIETGSLWLDMEMACLPGGRSQTVGSHLLRSGTREFALQTTVPGNCTTQLFSIVFRQPERRQRVAARVAFPS